MEEIKVKFFLSTRYIGSDINEIVAINIPKKATELEMEDIIKEIFEEWVWDNINNGWNILD